MSTTTDHAVSILTVSDCSALYASGTHDYDRCRVWCADCGRDVSEGMRYQLDPDVAQHVRLFHGGAR